MRWVIDRMELEDVPQVLEVDRESYTVPWPAGAYRREIMHNRNAHYFVLREVQEEDLDEHPVPEEARRRPLPFLPWRRGDQPRPGRIIGYAGMWLILDEAHVTTIAVREAKRGNGLGELLLASLVEASIEMGADRVTLEVRVSNLPAQRLYEKYGFRREGMRPRYYSDNNEDAYIMSVGQVRAAGYRQYLDTLIASLQERLRRPDLAVTSPVVSFALEEE